MTSSSPPIARVLRGGRVESLHRGNIAVADERGRPAGSRGDPALPVFIRSAGKPFQAIPLLEAGGAREFRLGSAEIALLCASHGGEPRHVRVVERLLRRGGFTVRDLACGAHWPMHEPSARALVRHGERPTALHNNCSGKHAGILLACRLYGYPPKGYWQPDHPIERKILDCIAEFCGVPVSEIPIAVDGCGLPVFELPLQALATGYARLVASANGAERPERASARRGIVAAMVERPEMVAGAARFTTDLLVAGTGRVIGKEGAEGVYALAAITDGGGGLGIAYKIEDGSSRPRDAVAVALLERLGLLSASARRRLAPYRSPTLRNVRGDVVGRLLPEDDLLDAG